MTTAPSNPRAYAAAMRSERARLHPHLARRAAALPVAAWPEADHDQERTGGQTPILAPPVPDEAVRLHRLNPFPEPATLLGYVTAPAREQRWKIADEAWRVIEETGQHPEGLEGYVPVAVLDGGAER